MRIAFRHGAQRETLTDASFRPYFFAVSKARPEGQGILAAEEVERVLFGERKRLWKVEVDSPARVPELRERFGRAFEADIPFLRRYLIDRGIRPFSGIADPKALVFDIEVLCEGSILPDSKKDRIVLVSYAVVEGGKITEKRVLSCIGEGPAADAFPDEKGMLAAFFGRVARIDPDIVAGYNSDNFDLPYIFARAKRLGVPPALGTDGSELAFRKRGRLGGMTPEIFGRQVLDIYLFVRYIISHNMHTQTLDLDSVAYELLGERKVEFDFEELPKLIKSGETRRFIEYSLQDSVLTAKLAEKFIPIILELASLLSLLPADVSRMTSGQIVEWLLVKESHIEGRVVPNRPGAELAGERDGQSFEGAFVREPEKGLHENLAVCDFRSLYPSIIISHNIDPDTSGKCSDGCENVSPTGDPFCMKKFGIIPHTLARIVSERAALKKRLKAARAEERVALDAKVYALKLISNSFYGYLGYQNSRWYSFEGARSTAGWGRKYIKDTISAAEKEGFRVVYGDSVTADRFVTVLDPEGMVRMQSVGELFEKFKSSAVGEREKEAIVPVGWKALSIDPRTRKPIWARITKVVRHKAGKRIFRVSQKFGETRVTEDHSIIVADGGSLSSAKPQEMDGKPFVKVGRLPPIRKINAIDLYEILKGLEYRIPYKGAVRTVRAHADGSHVRFNWARLERPVKILRRIRVGTPEFASLCRLLGAYILEGSSSTPETTKSRWCASISSSDKDWLLSLRKDYLRLFSNTKACVIRSTRKTRDLRYPVRGSERRTVYEDRTYKLQMMNKLAAVFFKALCGQKSSGKKLPDFIFHVPEKYKRLLLDNLVRGDGSHSTNPKLKYSREYIERNFRYTTKSLHLAGGFSLLLSELGRNSFMTYRPAKKVYTIGTSDRTNASLKTKIIEEEYSGHVYDLAVEGSHMFADSCGQVLLHNTDSIFFSSGEEGGFAKKAEQFVSSVNSKLPSSMELELQGMYRRGIFLTKKRYALISEGGGIVIKGLERVRRDWAGIARRTQEAVLHAILADGSPEKAAEIIARAVSDLKNRKVSIDDITIYTQLTKKPSQYKVTSPHVEAAKLAGSLKAGTIIKFAIVGSSKKGKGTISARAKPIEKVTLADYDPQYYIDNQLLPAVMRIMEAAGYSQAGEQKGLDSFL